MGKKGTNITDDPHPWDTLAKLLMEKGAQALASIALPGVQVGDALDKDLRVTNIEGDLFLDAYLDYLQIIVHFEFQKKKGTMVTKDGKVYRIKLPQTEKALPAIVAGVVKKEAEIEEITFSKPTLDQVFLDVVGRSMRDEESSGGDSGWENIKMERAR